MAAPRGRWKPTRSLTAPAHSRRARAAAAERLYRLATDPCTPRPPSSAAAGNSISTAHPATAWRAMATDTSRVGGSPILPATTPSSSATHPTSSSTTSSPMATESCIRTAIAWLPPTGGMSSPTYVRCSLPGTHHSLTSRLPSGEGSRLSRRPPRNAAEPKDRHHEYPGRSAQRSTSRRHAAECRAGSDTPGTPPLGRTGDRSGRPCRLRLGCDFAPGAGAAVIPHRLALLSRPDGRLHDDSHDLSPDRRRLGDQRASLARG